MSQELLKLESLSKAFGGVHAVQDVSLNVRPGEVLALLGHNGAGKSTLMKLLAGAEQPDCGQILLQGQAQHFAAPQAAQAAGIETIHQTLAVADHLDATANLFLGRELSTRWGLLDEAAMEQAARTAFVQLNPRFTQARGVPLASLSGGQRQMVAIARALHFKARVLILDEPCAALGPEESSLVHALIQRLRERGVGIVLVTHDLPDVFLLADRLAVMRHGRLLGMWKRADVSEDDVLALIVAGKKPQHAEEAP